MRRDFVWMIWTSLTTTGTAQMAKNLFLRVVKEVVVVLWFGGAFSWFGKTPLVVIEYVDDMLRIGNVQFRDRSTFVAELFEMAQDDNLPCLFSGFSLRCSKKEGTLTLTQVKNWQKLREMEPGNTFSDFLLLLACAYISL